MINEICLSIVTRLFIVYMDGCKREIRAENLGARLQERGTVKSLVAGLFVDDTRLLRENERLLQSLLYKTDRVPKRKKLKVSVGKSKDMVFERATEHTTD